MLGNGTHVSLEGRSSQLVDRIMDRTRARSVAIFLCDRTTPTPWVQWLHVRGLCDAVSQDYAKSGVYSHDPFLSATVVSNRLRSQSLIFLDARDRDVQQCADAARYWRFIDRHQLSVVGATVRPISNNLMLTVGLHGHADEPHATVSSAAQEMEWLTDMLMSELLESALLREDPRRLFSKCDGDGGQDDQRRSPRAPTSTRENEVIRLVANGMRNKQIAFQLAITENTVESHLRRIYQKLGIQNRAALVSYHLAARPTLPN